jgi:hypothetical protein
MADDIGLIRFRYNIILTVFFIFYLAYGSFMLHLTLL